MSKPSILHIAPENTAGVPYNVNKMLSEAGYKSRLITLYKIPFDFPEDICLNLPLPRNPLAMGWRRYKQVKLKKELAGFDKNYWTHLPYFREGNRFEKWYRNRREKKNEAKFIEALKAVDSDSFDVIHFGSGIDFYSDCRLAKKWKQQGKKIINCYFGDDLRTRGIVKEMDELADLNLTFEYDHILRHPDINFLFFPFEAENIKFISDEDYTKGGKIKVVHSPTDRFIKGTPEILEAIEKVKKVKDFKFILLENMPRDEVIKIKATCQIAIDQIGNRGGTGYGINSLETLAMGIPTITDMNCNMDTWLPENPFLLADAGNLSLKLIEIIENFDIFKKSRENLRNWVIKYHSYKSVLNKLTEYYRIAGIL